MSVLPQTIFPDSQRFRTLTRVGREVLIRFTFQVSFTSCTVCSGEPPPVWFAGTVNHVTLLSYLVSYDHILVPGCA